MSGANLVGKTVKLFFLVALREIPRAEMQQEWRHFRVSVVAVSCSSFFAFLLLVQPLHLSSSWSKTVSRCERAIHTFRGGNRSSDPLSKDYKASGAASRPEYEVRYSETNPSYFANNGANINKSIKICLKDWISLSIILIDVELKS